MSANQKASTHDAANDGAPQLQSIASSTSPPAIDEGLVLVDQSGTVRAFNRAAEQLFGFRADEVLGEHFIKLAPASGRHRMLRRLLRKVLISRRPLRIVRYQMEALRKNGTSFLIEVSISEAITEHGKVHCGLVRAIDKKPIPDIQKPWRLDSIHESRVNSMSDLAIGLSHEISQPLTAIINNAQACLRLMNSGSASETVLHEAIEQISLQGERAADIINRLRGFVENKEVRLSVGDVGSCISDVLILMKHDLAASHVIVHVDVADDLPPVAFDAIQIGQVVINLLRNAIDALANSSTFSPRITIQAKSAHPIAGVQISIVDNGSGFGDVSPARLFEPFYTSKSGGLGQGLSICRRIVDEHGGIIWAESSEPHGARFSLWLPMSHHPEALA